METKIARELRPIGDYIVIRQDDADEVSPGGILLPDAAQSKPTKGTVIATGPGKMLDDGTRGPMDVSEGDMVMYASFGGTPIEVDGEKLVVLRQEEVLFIIED